MVVLRMPWVIHVLAEGHELKQAESFKYLGVTFDSLCDEETAVNDIISRYSKNVDLLHPLLRDRYVPTAAKLILYKSVL